MNQQPSIADTDPQAQLPQPAAELLRLYGSHTLAFFGLAPKNRHFLAPGGAGLVNYQLMHKVAVVLGDPVCAPEACEYVTRSFLDFCARHRWRVAFYQAALERLAAYRSLHLRTFKMGEEAILHPQTFTLKGSALANVRTSCRRAEREGVRIQWYEGVPPVDVMQHLEGISRAWLGQKAGKQAAETGFSVGRWEDVTALAEQAETMARRSPLATASERTVPRFLTAVAITSTGQPCAFMTFTPIYGGVTQAVPDDPPGVGGWGWALDMMRRTPATPPGVMELLLVQALERLRSCGATVLSLGLVAWSDTLQEMHPVQRQLARWVTDRLHLSETHHSLFKFKQKFHPRWESRYLATRTILALPQVALVIARFRNYAGSTTP